MAEAKSTVPEPVEKKEKPPLTAEDFVTKWPLYTPFDFQEYKSPDRISFHCPRCSKETTWAISFRREERLLFFIEYQCTLCGSANLSVVYRISKRVPKTYMGPSGQETMHLAAQVQKIGQFPPLSIDIPRSLEKNLGPEATNLYKRALIDRNEGHGLGAVTYIRRVVEDKTDELIEVVAQLAETQSIDPGIVAKIRAVKNERATYEEKLKIAATVLPDSLVVDGANPLGVLYALVSQGVHNLSEKQCIDIADETKSVFEFTFTHLRAETKVRHDFVDKVKKLAGVKVPAPQRG
ncbi:MAG TPA: hypothetical protein VIH89_07050 [Candidatus Sulfotelmatobacter sp.]